MKRNLCYIVLKFEPS